MKKTVFIKNAAVMTASSFLLRVLGLIFKVWTAQKIGDAGIGLYQVIFSVYAFLGSFAATGLSTAVTRLCAENCATGKNPFKTLSRCIKIAFFFGSFLFLSVLLCGSAIAKQFVGKREAAVCIKIISASLPFIGMSSCLRGFFISQRRAAPCAVSQIFEQSVRIFLSFFLLQKFARYGIVFSCAALTAGDTAAEVCAFVYLYFRSKAEKSRCEFSLHKTDCKYSAIFRIAFPLTCGKAVGSLLRTTENVAVPKFLAKGGAGTNGGLSLFGNIKGMALPILLFPCSLVSSVSALLLPEISAARKKNQIFVLKNLTEQIIKLTLIFSVFFAVFFAEAGLFAGRLLYHSEQVGVLLALLAPLVPFMYLDAISDGILNGLDCQKFCFVLGISDSALRVLGVMLFVPKFKMAGFLGVMYFSNFFTGILNSTKLLKKSRAKIDPFKWVFLPLLFAIIISKSCSILIGCAVHSDLVYIILFGVTFAVLFFAALFLSGIMTEDDIKAVI